MFTKYGIQRMNAGHIQPQSTTNIENTDQRKTAKRPKQTSNDSTIKMKTLNATGQKARTA